MYDTVSTTMRINGRVENIAYSLNEIVNQLKSLKPHQRVYKGKGDYSNFDPSGFIERIAFTMYYAAKQNTKVMGIEGGGLYCERGGTYDHSQVQSFLEETLHTLRARRFTTMVSVYKFYFAFREKLWSLRD